MNRKQFLLAALAATSCQFAWSQAWPQKVIKLQVPFSAGGTTDIIARSIAEPLGKALGQTVIVENKAGGGGTVGAAETARAAPDGYTLGIATVSTTAANPAINPRTPYHPINDFTPIINIAATPNVIAAHPKLPFQDYKGMLAAVKKEPGKYAYASPGNGSITHLMMEMFKLSTQTFMVHVPYRGSGPALNDAVAGQVPLIFDNLPSALPFIKEKRLTALVVAAPQRVPALPDVPTFKELGLESVNRMAYYGIIGPKGLPKDVVDRINAAVRKVVQDPAIRKRIEETGSIIMADTPEAFAKQMREELAVYKDVVAKQKLTLD